MRETRGAKNPSSRAPPISAPGSSDRFAVERDAGRVVVRVEGCPGARVAIHEGDEGEGSVAVGLSVLHAIEHAVDGSLGAIAGRLGELDLSVTLRSGPLGV